MSLLPIRLFVRQLYPQHQQEPFPRITAACTLQILASVVGCEAKNKYHAYTFSDGTGTVNAIRWIAEGSDSGMDLYDLAVKVLVEGKISEGQLTVSRICRCDSDYQAAYWRARTLYLQKKVYPHSLPPTGSAVASETLSKIHTLKLIPERSTEEELIALLKNTAVDISIKDLLDEGIICRLPDDRYYKLPHRKVQNAILSVFSRSKDGAHYRYVKNCLRADGYLIGERGVLDALGSLVNTGRLTMLRSGSGMFILAKSPSSSILFIQ